MQYVQYLPIYLVVLTGDNQLGFPLIVRIGLIFASLNLGNETFEIQRIFVTFHII